jgi:signal-transduction protein with cAMP-binding, CBS, and nucleotidyltransferase domain
MSISNSLITAVVVAFVLGLIKAIDWLLSKRRDNQNDSLSELQAEQLEKVTKTSDSIKHNVIKIIETGSLTKEQEELIEEIHKMIEHLNELHSVYDGNHVPKWYVPSDLVDRLIKIDSKLELLNLRQSESLDEIKDLQNEVFQKISNLISSQNHLTDRIGDLINILNKNRG